MAKSFKQLPSDAAQPVKRTSEKDLLDFLEQDWLTVPTPANAVLAAPEEKADRTGHVTGKVTSETDNTGVINNMSNINNTDNTSTPANSSLLPEPATQPVTSLRKPAAKKVLPKEASNTSITDVTQEHYATIVTDEHDVDARQTFVLGLRYLEGLKNYVHTQRMNGQYDFTQKQALHQALDLLFATAQIQERPLQIRQKEEVRRQQIRKGKLK